MAQVGGRYVPLGDRTLSHWWRARCANPRPHGGSDSPLTNAQQVLHGEYMAVRDRFAVELWLRSIPASWEDPEVSPEFQALLDEAAPDRQV